MFFDSWYDIGRTLLIGAAAYVSLVVVLRVSGKRTLAKMNAFDLVVTVAFGSTLATILLSSEVSLAEGIVALTLLSVAQFVVTWLSTRSRLVRDAVRSSPALLVDGGELCARALRNNRVTENEVFQAIRSSGSGSLEQIAAVVLETDGSFSVITDEKFGSGSAMADVDQPFAGSPPAS